MLRGLSSVLLVSGALLLADAGVTVAWQEPISALYADIRQRGLGDELDALENAEPTERERRALAALPNQLRRIAFLARSLRGRSQPGDAIGRIRIPAIGLESVVVSGTAAADLRAGPGHYAETPLPGAGGTTAIAGHRTTYKAPFREIDELRRDDTIVVEMPYGRFYYRVEKTRIVEPDALEVIRRVSSDRLVLTACHPLYSAAQRIVVFAKPVRTQARGAALATG